MPYLQGWEAQLLVGPFPNSSAQGAGSPQLPGELPELHASITNRTAAKESGLQILNARSWKLLLQWFVVFIEEALQPEEDDDCQNRQQQERNGSSTNLSKRG